MKGHWLFGFVEGSTWGEINRWIEAQMAADPEAAEIPELEAEQFAGLCYLLLFAGPSMLHLFKKGLQVTLPSDRPHERRRTVIAILRKWRQRTLRNVMISMLPRTIMGRFVDPELNPEFWTPEHFLAAYHEGMNICLLAHYKRFLDPTVDISEWLPTLTEYAPHVYAAWIQIARLTMRRVVYPTVGAVGAEAEPAAALLEDVKSKSAEAGSLRHDLRRAEQDRKRLKEETRRREVDRKLLLSQAEGELAAARRQLNDRRQAMHRELADLARRHEAELTKLRRELEQAQAEFLSAVRGRAVNFLRGKSVAVQGGETQENRLLVETLGGTWTTANPSVMLAGDAGPHDLERQLHGVALTNVQIRCDGSRRRKGQRPAIATSAFAVYLDEQTVFRDHRVICCGKAASSQMAEYAAVVMALGWLLTAGPAPGNRAEIWSDCRTMVDQVTGRRTASGVPRGCRTLDRKLHKLMDALRRQGCTVVLRWVPREKVDACDRLCDLAYREATWYHRPAANGHRLSLTEFIQSLGLAARNSYTISIPTARSFLSRSMLIMNG